MDDIGVTMQMPAVGPHCDDRPVQRFRTFTEDLHRLADWFARCCVMTVVSNVTGATGTGIMWSSFGAPGAASMVDRCLYQVSGRLSQSCFVRRGDDLIEGGERVGFAMTTALRDDFDAQGLRVLARQSKHAGQARRLLALAAIYEGGRRSDAARIGGVTLQIVRDWA